MSEIVTITKMCTTCNEEKPHAEFRKQSKNKDGLKYTCRKCDDIRASERYQSKKSEIVPRIRKWQTENMDKMKIYKRRYNRRSSRAKR